MKGEGGDSVQASDRVWALAQTVAPTWLDQSRDSPQTRCKEQASLWALAGGWDQALMVRAW